MKQAQGGTKGLNLGYFFSDFKIPHVKYGYYSNCCPQSWTHHRYSTDSGSKFWLNPLYRYFPTACEGHAAATKGRWKLIWILDKFIKSLLFCVYKNMKTLPVNDYFFFFPVNDYWLLTIMTEWIRRVWAGPIYIGSTPFSAAGIEYNGTRSHDRY